MGGARVALLIDGNGECVVNSTLGPCGSGPAPSASAEVVTHCASTSYADGTIAQPPAVGVRVISKELC